MSTEYTEVLIVGNGLEHCWIEYNTNNEGDYADKWDYREGELYSEGMEGEYKCGYIGFKLESVYEISELGAMKSKAEELAKKFEDITGVKAKLAACVNCY